MLRRGGRASVDVSAESHEPDREKDARDTLVEDDDADVDLVAALSLAVDTVLVLQPEGKVAASQRVFEWVRRGRPTHVRLKLHLDGARALLGAGRGREEGKVPAPGDQVGLHALNGVREHGLAVGRDDRALEDERARRDEDGQELAASFEGGGGAQRVSAAGARETKVLEGTDCQTMPSGLAASCPKKLTPPSAPSPILTPDTSTGRVRSTAIWTSLSRLAEIEYFSSVVVEPVCLIVCGRDERARARAFVSEVDAGASCDRGPIGATHDLVRRNRLAVGLELGQRDRLPDDLLGLGVVALEDEVDLRGNEHDAGGG